MPATLTHTGIVDRVRGILGDGLGMDKDDIKQHSFLDRDLGAESIDYLDLVFRLEKEFSIRVPPSFSIEPEKVLWRINEVSIPFHSHLTFGNIVEYVERCLGSPNHYNTLTGNPHPFVITKLPPLANSGDGFQIIDFRLLQREGGPYVKNEKDEDRIPPGDYAEVRSVHFFPRCLGQRNVFIEMCLTDVHHDEVIIGFDEMRHDDVNNATRVRNAASLHYLKTFAATLGRSYREGYQTI